MGVFLSVSTIESWSGRASGIRGREPVTQATLMSHLSPSLLIGICIVLTPRYIYHAVRPSASRGKTAQLTYSLSVKVVSIPGEYLYKLS